PDRSEEECAKEDKRHDAKDLELGPSRPAHCSHLAVRRWSTAYSPLTMATITISTTACAFANPGSCRPTSLVIALLICSGRIGPPWLINAAAVAYAERALAKSSRVEPRNAGASSGPAMWRQ